MVYTLSLDRANLQPYTAHQDIVPNRGLENVANHHIRAEVCQPTATDSDLVHLIQFWLGAIAHRQSL
jgi:hypothetical protein